MGYPELKLRRNSERLLIRGHPWVYSGAVASAPSVAPGEIVDVWDFRSRFVARGYYNPHSTIAVRVLTRDRDCAIDRGFLARAIRRSVLVRRGNPELAAATDAVRLVHGENDGLPGLVVDDYAGYLVVQFHTLGMELLRSEILDALEEVAEPRGIHERSDVGTRRADGLKDRRSGHLRGEQPPRLIEIREGAVHLCVDVRRGQKTGFFLDQRDNRLLLGRYACGPLRLRLFRVHRRLQRPRCQGGRPVRGQRRHRQGGRRTRGAERRRQQRRFPAITARSSPTCFRCWSSCRSAGPGSTWSSSIPPLSCAAAATPRPPPASTSSSTATR